MQSDAKAQFTLVFQEAVIVKQTEVGDKLLAAHAHLADPGDAREDAPAAVVVLERHLPEKHVHEVLELVR